MTTTTSTPRPATRLRTRRRRGNLDYNAGPRAMAKLAEMNAKDAEARTERAAAADKPAVAEAQLKMPANRQWRYEHSQLPHEAMARKGRAAPTLAMVRNGLLPPGGQPRNTRQGIDRKASMALAHARAEMAQ